MKKKILFYNWDPIAGPAGGGVTSYLTELISRLICDANYEVWFLNSGRKYTKDGQPRLEERENPFGDKVQSYEIVNSPVLAPGNQSIVNIRKYLEDEIIYKLCKKLIEKAKGFHVIHYHNLEGLSLKVLTLKKEFPNTKFIYSFHNYFPICTQVNLWKDNQENCHNVDFKECGKCYEKANYDLTLFRFQHIDIPMLKDIFLEYSKKYPDKDDLNLYGEFRNRNILYFNQYVDIMLAVSQRTKEVLVKNGMDGKKVRTVYVGSKIAENQKEEKRIDLSEEVLRIVYLGYMRKDKGFYFFLDALHDMDNSMAKKIAVTIIAKYSDKNKQEIQELLEMKTKFYDISLYNGFRDYEELKKILLKQHLGIVPVLWEDNLPRVALEQVAFGIPILSSNTGGASELCGRNPDFTFVSGDKKDFINKLNVFVKEKKRLLEYEKKAIKLTTMSEHLKELKSFFDN